MALKFKCADVGFDCGWVAKGKTEDEILAQCATHATQDHKMKPEEITEELRTKIKANIHKSWF
jgi:predicted small metal-binding protein